MFYQEREILGIEEHCKTSDNVTLVLDSEKQKLSSDSDYTNSILPKSLSKNLKNLNDSTFESSDVTKTKSNDKYVYSLSFLEVRRKIADELNDTLNLSKDNDTIPSEALDLEILDGPGLKNDVNLLKYNIKKLNLNMRTRI